MNTGYINIEELISSIKKRPRMYVYEVRVDYIYYLLVGCLISNLRSVNAQRIDYVFKRDFIEWVIQWLYKNKEVDFRVRNKIILWYQMISECAHDDEEAVNLFFQISEEFFAEYHKRFHDSENDGVTGDHSLFSTES